MLTVNIVNFSDLVLNKNFEKVNFYSNNEGFIGVYPNHEKMEFQITPSKLVLTENKKETVFYMGYGFGFLKNNFLKIIGFPISPDLNQFNYVCCRLNDYGQKCKENFNRFLSE